MRSAQTEDYWRSFQRHMGVNHTDYRATHFRTEPDAADRLLENILAGAMRAATGPRHFFEAGRHERMPTIGDYTILLDGAKRPRLIWQTTGVSVAPLSSVDEAFVWRDGIGDGDRAEWLRLHQVEYARQGRIYGFQMHDEIETVFVSFEVVWPADVARRIQLLAPHLDRGVALLRRMREQRSIASALEAILARIQTAVLTVTPAMRIGFVNPAAETLLRREDGLRTKGGYLAAMSPIDQRALTSAVASASGARAGVVIPIRRRGDMPVYRACIFALPQGDAASALTRDATVVLFIDDCDENHTSAMTDVYARAFRLTPAEARLAVHLVSGVSLTDAADAFGVTHNTVRAQLRAIFDKTDTHRQSDLVRLLQATGSLRISLS